MLNINGELNEINSSKQFNITLNSYEGPIDLLLDLARKQKVDLSEISILELSEQYINFINQYQDIHLEIAADYLVMAAWLTYLKSRLLLPKEEKSEDHTPEELEELTSIKTSMLNITSNVRNILSFDLENDEGNKLYDVTPSAATARPFEKEDNNIIIDQLLHHQSNEHPNKFYCIQLICSMQIKIVFFFW